MRLCDFPDGLTILANLVGNPPAVRFIVDNIVTRTERVAPFSIAGDEDDTFNRWNPPIGRKVRIEARINRDRYYVDARFI